MKTFSELYGKLRNKSEQKSLKQEAEDTFQTAVEKQLTKVFLDIDSDSDVTVVFASDDISETKRSISADYSIDINAEGYEVDTYGFARLNTNSQYSTTMKTYRNSETGRDHDYVDTVNVTAYSSKSFVKDFVNRILKVWKEATEED